jgi:hypothetical protein
MPTSIAELPAQKASAPTTPAQSRGLYYNTGNAFNVSFSDVPDNSFVDQPRLALDHNSPTALFTCDSAKGLNTDFPATTPLVLAHYARVRAGETLVTNFEASGVIVYVMVGAGSTECGTERVDWKPGDVFILPGGCTHTHKAGTEHAVLWIVTNEPQLSFERLRSLGQTVPLDGNPGQQDRLGFTIRVPVGVVCAITPFNSPLNAVLHKVGPALAAGNAVILKPSGYTPVTASMLCDALLDAGLPPGLISLMNGEAEVGQCLLNDQGIDFYAFTGSTRVGRLIQAGAGLRRTQLELGSIACTIVCADADLSIAIPKIARASFRKAGQVCTSIQRLYVEASILEEVTSRLVKAAAEMPCGDPRRPETLVGPMISVSEAQRAFDWIQEASDQHACVEHGGQRDGAVLQPTVLSNVRPGMSVIDREIFAPVVSMLPIDNLHEAIQGINSMQFGLAAGIFTKDLSRALTAARAIKVGARNLELEGRFDALWWCEGQRLRKRGPCIRSP